MAEHIIKQSDAYFGRKSKFLILKVDLSDVWKKFKYADSFEPSVDRLILAKIPKKFIVGRVFFTVLEPYTGGTLNMTVRLGDTEFSTIQAVGTFQIHTAGDKVVNAPFREGRNDKLFRIPGYDMYVYANLSTNIQADRGGKFVMGIELIDTETKECSLGTN